MKNDTIQTRKWITTCLMALLTFCLVLTGVFFIAPIEAEAAESEPFTITTDASDTISINVNYSSSAAYSIIDIGENKTVVIEGNGHKYTKIPTTAQHRDEPLLRVEKGTSVTVNNFVFDGGWTDSSDYNDYMNAPLIVVESGGELVLNNCIVQNIYTTKNAKGGGIYVADRRIARSVHG